MIHKDIKELIIKNYPTKGKQWIMNQYCLTEAQVRQFCYRNKLKLDHNGVFFKDFQKRAALGKLGKKYPKHTENLKNRWKRGDFAHHKGKTHPVYKERVNKICVQCNNIFKELESDKKILCSSKCRKKWFANQWNRKPHPKGFKGKKRTDEWCKMISKANTGRKLSPEHVLKVMKTKMKKYGYIVPPGNRHKASWKAGWREIGGLKKYYRSRWEANYARYLQFLKEKGEIKDWKHEPDTFWFEKIKRGCRSYLPDFKVTENNGDIIYHEVKGWMDARSKTKLKRMKKYYPEIKLIVIGKSEYRELEKMGRLLSFE